MAEPIPVTLSEHWRVYVEGLVQNQRFASVSDALESGLRLLEADEHASDRLAELLEEGEQSGDAGPWDLQSFLDEAHERHGRQAA